MAGPFSNYAIVVKPPVNTPYLSKAASSRRALYSGVGRHRRRASRSGSGISIWRSALTSWPIRAVGNGGARSSGPIGCPLPGWRTGGGGYF